MVNVDFSSPALILGGGLIGVGVVLLQLRSSKTNLAKDADIVVAAMLSVVGGTLMFQGWRLDPLLLLCQVLTTAVAIYYGLETLRMRQKEQQQQDLREQQDRVAQPPYDNGLPSASQSSQPGAAGGFQPPARDYMPLQPPPPTQRSWMSSFMDRLGNRGSPPEPPYLPPSQQQPYPYSSPQSQPTYQEWGGQLQAGPEQQQQQQRVMDRGYSDTIRYDYYGQPLPETMQPGVSPDPSWRDGAQPQASGPASDSSPQFYGQQGAESFGKSGGAGVSGYLPPGTAAPQQSWQQRQYVGQDRPSVPAWQGQAGRVPAPQQQQQQQQQPIAEPYSQSATRDERDAYANSTGEAVYQYEGQRPEAAAADGMMRGSKIQIDTSRQLRLSAYEQVDDWE